MGMNGRSCWKTDEVKRRSEVAFLTYASRWGRAPLLKHAPGVKGVGCFSVR